MFTRLVTEMVGNPLQLHQAADKGETTFLILDAVIPDAVTAVQLILNVDLVFTQQRIDDLRYRLPLEYTQVAVAFHRP